MKKMFLFVLLVFLACRISNAGNQKAYDSMLTVQVVDDFGLPVSNATIAASTFKTWHPGENFGRNENLVITSITDSNGLAVFEMPCISGKITYGTRDIKGYYKTHSAKYVFSNAKDGKWQPWNPTVTLILKRILNPIPLYAKYFSLPHSEPFPAKDKPVGFDLIKGDWIAPYGKGTTADFVFTLKSKPEETAMTRYGPVKLFDDSLTLNFSNEGDGIQGVLVDKPGSSLLCLPREAPTNGYIPELVKEVYQREPDAPPRSNIQGENQNYFFRVRTKKDVEGNIVSALYGKIHGDFDGFDYNTLRFTYYVNPTPNNRNLEFDPSQNLFPGERVEEP